MLYALNHDPLPQLKMKDKISCIIAEYFVENVTESVDYMLYLVKSAIIVSPLIIWLQNDELKITIALQPIWFF